MRATVRNRYFFFSDLLLLPVAACFSFILRLEDLDLSNYWPGLLLFTLCSMSVTLIAFVRTRIYARYWRYATVDELLLLVIVVSGSALGAGILALGMTTLLPEIVIPRSVPFIFILLALSVTVGSRLLARPLMVGRRLQRQSARERPATPVLVMGAGDAGSMMVRELRQNPQLGITVVGFIDDDPAKLNIRIHGIPVIGNHNDIPVLVKEHTIKEVIIAMPTAPGKVIRKIREICERAGTRTRIMPGIYELLDGKATVNQLRDVQIEDLLRRKPVRTNTTMVGQLIKSKRVLVTGGGGSIGGELCRQLVRFEPAELVIIGHGENSVFTIHNELKTLLSPQTHLTVVIADIRFGDRIRQIFERYRPEIVFHAAAHKHVPLMEQNPAEAITNNVLGTRNLLDAAREVNVSHFVMISSDKAVNPTNIMGASKRVAELLVHEAATEMGKAYVAVRFGNVLGSRGSVVLTFKQQIAGGGPVTVTHPEMRRYFMTIPEAVQLVLQAAALGKGGEVFTLDMGEPVKIVDLAKDMIELSGLRVGQDIDIAFSGIRPGEKLYEELFVPGESYERTFHEKIFIACNASSFVPRMLNETVHALALAADRDDRTSIVRHLHTLVPQMRLPELEPGAVAVGENVPVSVRPDKPLVARTVGG